MEISGVIYGEQSEKMFDATEHHTVDHNGAMSSVVRRRVLESEPNRSGKLKSTKIVRSCHERSSAMKSSFGL